ncbi:MAG TPA: aquaporin, partial [Pseudonocardia sp.]
MAASTLLPAMAQARDGSGKSARVRSVVPSSRIGSTRQPFVMAVFSGVLLIALILSPPGRRSGGHMNPAVTIALWLMDVFPGLSVLPY